MKYNHNIEADFRKSYKLTFENFRKKCVSILCVMPDMGNSVVSAGHTKYRTVCCGQQSSVGQFIQRVNFLCHVKAKKYSHFFSFTGFE